MANNSLPSKPSLIKTWAVFGATAVLLILIAVTGDEIALSKIEIWQKRTTWFLALLFGSLGVTFSIQLVHCTALSSYWPSLVISLTTCVIASLAFSGMLTWGAGIGLALIAIAVMVYKALSHQHGRQE